MTTHECDNLRADIPDLRAYQRKALQHADDTRHIAYGTVIRAVCEGRRDPSAIAVLRAALTEQISILDAIDAIDDLEFDLTHSGNGGATT